PRRASPRATRRGWPRPRRSASTRASNRWLRPAAPRSPSPSPLRSLGGHLDLAGDDVEPDLLDPGAHRVADERAVVLVVDVVDAALGQAELQDAALPRPLLRALDRLEHGLV